MNAGTLGDQRQPGGKVVARLDVADQHPQGLAVVLAEGAEIAHGRCVGQGRRIGKGQRRLGAGLGRDPVQAGDLGGADHAADAQAVVGAVGHGHRRIEGDGGHDAAVARIDNVAGGDPRRGEPDGDHVVLQGDQIAALAGKVLEVDDDAVDLAAQPRLRQVIAALFPRLGAAGDAGPFDPLDPGRGRGALAVVVDDDLVGVPIAIGVEVADPVGVRQRPVGDLALVAPRIARAEQPHRRGLGLVDDDARRSGRAGTASPGRRGRCRPAPTTASPWPRPRRCSSGPWRG